MKFTAQVTLTVVSLALTIALAGCSNRTNTIPISSIEELQKIGKDPNYPLNGDYILTQDIDASATATWNNGAGFIPIANGGYDTYIDGPYFNGTLDGKGHVISHLIINDSTDFAAGLFAFMGDPKYYSLHPRGHIKNLGLRGGTVAGAASCSSVGALIGENNGGTITNCYSTANVWGDVRGAVSGGVGGLVGWCTSGRITNCYATGTVSSPEQGQEGYYAGGLVGFVPGGSITDASALLSRALMGPYMTNSYWDTDTSGQSAAAWTYNISDHYAKWTLGVAGETTAALMHQATFSGWDFTNVWNISEGASLPFLRTGTMLIVTIQPAGAVSAGARWSIDNGKTWKDSGTVLDNVSPGSITISFSTVTGWTTPAGETVTVAAGETVTVAEGETATATGTYTQ